MTGRFWEREVLCLWLLFLVLAFSGLAGVRVMAQARASGTVIQIVQRLLDLAPTGLFEYKLEHHQLSERLDSPSSEPGRIQLFALIAHQLWRRA